MPTRKLLRAAAVGAAVATGGLAGVMLGVPASSGAQETPPTAEAGRPAPWHAHELGPDLGAAATALGMTVEELRTELAAGRSIADVAAAEGVELQTVVDALVADASARLDERKAELPARMAELVQRDGPPWRGKGRMGRPAARNAVDDAATALGMPRQELVDALRAGRSIAAVAAERGTSIDEVKAAMIADATERIDRAVEDGRLDPDRAAEMKAALADKVDAAVQREGLPPRGR